LAVRHSLARHGQAQIGDGVQEVLGADVGTNLATRCRGFEQRPEGMGTLVWSPLAKGMLTGRIRRGQQTDLRRATILTSLSDERRLDAVEQIIPLAEQAGLPMRHLAMAFAIAHPGVTSAIIGPRTMNHLDDLLAGIDVTLTDEILDRIDEIVPPGTDVGTPDQSAYLPPALQRSNLRRRPVNERAAA
jgi:aryl-alcohol dehydrogenase-like predicted oxidoreductase